MIRSFKSLLRLFWIAVAGAILSLPNIGLFYGLNHWTEEHFGFGARTIALIDDVHTSGATAAACTRVLKRGGAKRVILLCWARVLDSEAPD